jgi:NAD(P)-dependent dehydrogenase (short-subunit alcohol dehydrogenase family)
MAEFAVLLAHAVNGYLSPINTGARVELTGRVVVLTGAAHGIGAAMARRFAAGGAARVAAEITAAGGRAVAPTADATSKKDLKALVAAARTEFGPVDLFCANAGAAFGTGVHAADEQWAKSWELNVMQHVHAAQVVLPTMLARLGGRGRRYAGAGHGERQGRRRPAGPRPTRGWCGHPRRSFPSPSRA